jgi:cellobiose-specific phosphotransferase system component IIC
LPAPVGAVLACGDWRALLLELFDLALATAIWWPFARRCDARRLAVERPADAAAAGLDSELRR